MIEAGYVIGKIGVLIIWMFKGFKGSFYDVESKYYKYDFIIGFIFLCVIAYLIFLWGSLLSEVSLDEVFLSR